MMLTKATHHEVEASFIFVKHKNRNKNTNVNKTFEEIKQRYAEYKMACTLKSERWGGGKKLNVMP